MDDDLEELLQGVRGRIRKERGAISRVRALPAWPRVVLGAGAAAGLVALSAAMWWNPGGTLGVAALAPQLVASGALALVALGIAYRPLHRRAVPRALEVALVMAAVTAPAVIVVARQGTWLAAMRGQHCFWRGLVVACVATAFAWALDRDAHTRAGTRLLASVFGGLVGALSMEVACRAGDSAHALVMHAPIAIAFVIVYASIRRVTRGGRMG